MKMKKNYITPTIRVHKVKLNTHVLVGSENPLMEGGDDYGNGISNSKRKYFDIWMYEDENPEDER